MPNLARRDVDNLRLPFVDHRAGVSLITPFSAQRATGDRSGPSAARWFTQSLMSALPGRFTPCDFSGGDMEFYEYARDSARDLIESQIGVFGLLRIVEDHQTNVEAAASELEPILLEAGTSPETAERAARRIAQTALFASDTTTDESVRDLAARVAHQLRSLGDGDSDPYEDVLGGITLKRNLAARARESLLVTLWSDFEAFLSDILLQLAERDPRPLIAADHKVSVDELSRYDTPRDLMIEIARRKAAGMLHDTLDQAVDVFCRTYKLHKPPVTDHLREAYQRRNVVVHARAVANASYLEKIEGLEVPKPGPGERLSVDRDYLTRTADQLILLAFALAVSASLKFSNDSVQEVERAFVNLPYFLLIANRPGAVTLIGEEFVQKRFADQKSREITRVNHMIALRDLGEDAALNSMLHAWDDGALDDRFALARLCLERKFDEALVLAKTLIASGAIDSRFWDTWPLFRELRSFAFQRNRRPRAATVDTAEGAHDTESAQSSTPNETEEPAHDD